MVVERCRYWFALLGAGQLRVFREAGAGFLGTLALFLALGLTAGSAGAIPIAEGGAPIGLSPVSPDLVISQLYGGGGAPGAPWKNDFVELFNRGDTAVDVTGWSVQYAPAGSSTWQSTALTGAIAPGRYYLLAEAGAESGVELPAPELTGTIDLSATDGRVALVAGAAPLACTKGSEDCSAHQAIRDLVGYGGQATAYEGSGSASGPSETAALFRAGGGCVDSGDNAADFLSAPPDPRTGATLTHRCTLRPSPLKRARLSHRPRPRAIERAPRKRPRHRSGMQRPVIEASANATHVSGAISANTTWTPAGNPYIIDSTLTVAGGVTLTVQPGVLVEFAGGSFSRLIVGGALVANGTAAAPVIFTAASDTNAASCACWAPDYGPETTARGSWYDIELSGPGSQFSYAMIRYGGYGSDGFAYGSVVLSNGAGTVPFDHVVVQYSASAGIRSAVGTTANVSWSYILNNTGAGLSVTDRGRVLVSKSVLNSNGSGVGFSGMVNTSGFLDSQIDHNVIAFNGGHGVEFQSVDSSIPDNLWAHGEQNDIAYNGGWVSSGQFGGHPPASIDWEHNYWGPFAYQYSNYAGCSTASYLAGEVSESIGGYWIPIGVAARKGITLNLPNGDGNHYCGNMTPTITAWSSAVIPITPDGTMPPGQTIGCTSLDATNTAACQASANTLSGSFTTSTVDIALPAYGIPFRFKRTYASNETDPGRLGPRGWRDNYSASLEVDQATGDVTVHSENGQKVKYTKLPDGSFAGANPGALSTLAASGGGYDLTRRDRTVLHFDAAGQLLSEKDRNGQGLTFGYANGKLMTITDAPGRTITLSYNQSNGYLSDITTPAPDSRHVHYDYTGDQLTSVTDVRQKVWTYAYDPSGKLASLRDPDTHYRYRNTYDPSSGRLTQKLDPLGSPISYSWDAATQTATVTDQANQPWKHHYDDGYLASRTDPNGKSTTYDYDKQANTSSVTDRNGNTTRMFFDARGNMLRRVSPEPFKYVECWTYDDKNDVLSYTDRRGHTTGYEYDASGNLKKLTRPDPDEGGPLAAPVTSYGYDPAGTGELISLTDPRSHTTSYGYDATGNRTSVTTPLGNKTGYGYDPAGNVSSIVDPRGNVAGANPADYTTSFSYDPAGHRLSKTDALGNATTYGYDDAGNRTTVTRPDPDGNGPLVAPVTSYSYDAADRLHVVTAPDGSTSSIDYDVRGHVSARTDAMGKTTSYSYGAVGRLISKVTPRGNAVGCNCAAQYTWSYDYDANGNRISAVDPLGSKTVSEYDSLNRRKKTTAYEGQVYGAVAVDAPAGDWRLDETSGPSAADASGNGRSGSYAGGYTLGSAGVANTAVSLDGSSGRIAVPDSPGLRLGGQGTLELWLYLRSATDEQFLIGKADSAYALSYGIQVENDPGNPQPALELWVDSDGGWGPSAAAQTPFNLTLNTWHHVVGEWDASGLRLYVDNALAASGPAASAIGNATSLRIGGGASGWIYANAIIDEAAVYPSALSPARIQAHREAAGAGAPRVTSYGYDANDNRTSLTDPLQRTTSSVYDNLDRLTSTTRQGVSPDPSPTTAYGYDPIGNRTSVTSPLGNTTGYAYDDDNRLSSIVDPRGNVAGCGCAAQYTWSYGYDPAGHPTSVSDPVNPTHPLTYGYRRDGRKDRVTDQLGHTTSYGYDPLGRLHTVTAPDLSQTTYSYDDAHNKPDDLASRVDANQHTTQYLYDLDHRLTTTIDPLGHSWTYDYDAAGNRIKQVDGKAHAAGNDALGTTIYGYDALNRLQSVDYSDSAANPDVSYGYDGFGERIAMADGGTGQVSYSYDADGELKSESRGSDSFSYSYDSLRNLKQEIYPGGTTVDYGHDLDGRLASVTSGGLTTSYGYDAAAHPTTTTLPAANGYAETRTYDGAGRLTEIKNAKGGSVLSDYALTLDYAGNPTQLTKLGGALESYGYDGSNRLTSVCYQLSCPNAGDPYVRWTYDSLGNRKTETRPGQSTTYTYNDADELTQAATSLPGTNPYPGQVQADGAQPYWRLGETSGTSFASAVGSFPGTWSGSPTLGVAGALNGDANKAVGLNGASQYGSVADANQLDKTSSFSLELWVKRTKNAAVQAVVGKPLTATTKSENYAFWFDTANKIRFEVGAGNKSATVTSAAALDTNWHHVVGTFASGALKLYLDGALSASATASGFTSAAANASTLDLGRAGTASYFGGSLDELALYGTALSPAQVADHYSKGSSTPPPQTSSTSYAYDANGRQTGAGANTFGWNMADQLTSATIAGQSSSYSYDGDAKRLSATAGGATTNYLWDSNSPVSELPQLALERDGQGNLLRRYLYGLDPGPLSLTTTAGSFYYHYDGFGSVTNLTDVSGALEWSYDYEPFGPLRSPPVKNDPAAPANPMQYDGQYYDGTTSLYDLRARQYDPGSGRFLSTDPLDPDETSPYISAYAYTDDRPTLLADPSGMYWGEKWVNKGKNAVGDSVDWVRDNADDATAAAANEVGNIVSDTIDNAADCLGGSVSGCAWTALNLFPIGRAARLGEALAADGLLGFAAREEGRLAARGLIGEGSLISRLVHEERGELNFAGFTRATERVESPTGLAANAGDNVVYHYTDDVGRRAIEQHGQIRNPFPGGENFFTPSKFCSGAQARECLAMGKTPTGYFEVPRSRLPASTRGPFAVQGPRGPTGAYEYITPDPVDVADLPFRPFPGGAP